jgi:dihydrodipicolinate synthase/N-acetylneuraminate lyase
VDLVRAAHAKDAVRATQLQAQVTELTQVYEQGHWLPALKNACAQLGLGNGRPAPPLEPAGAAARAAIAALLARLG